MSLRGAAGKAVVIGLLQRHGEVCTLVVDKTKRRTLQPVVKEHVEKGAQVFTDGTRSDARTRFQKFQDLTRHILTTPKTELVEQAAKASRPGKGKKK